MVEFVKLPKQRLQNHYSDIPNHVVNFVELIVTKFIECQDVDALTDNFIGFALCVFCKGGQLVSAHVCYQIENLVGLGRRQVDNALEANKGQVGQECLQE